MNPNPCLFFNVCQLHGTNVKLFLIFIVRHTGEKSNVEALGETLNSNSADLNSQKFKRLSLKDKSPMNSSDGEGEISDAPGLLVFEYLEHEQPYSRRPLTDKANLVPEIRFYWLKAYFLFPELIFVLHPFLPDRYRVLKLNFQN